MGDFTGQALSRLVRGVIVSWVIGSWSPWLYPQLSRVDPSFTPPVVESSGESGSLRVLALPGNKTLVAHGPGYVNGQRVPSLVRLQEDATLDATFIAPALTGVPQLVCAYADGRVLVSDGSGRMVRLLPDGTSDPAFHGVSLSPVSQLRAALGSDGPLWIWGGTDLAVLKQGLALLTSEGRPDERFRPPATLTFFPRDAAVISDGRLMLVGAVRVGEDYRQGVFRINFDGTIDATFDASAVFPAGQMQDEYPSVIAVLPSGDIHVASRKNSWRLQSHGARVATYLSAVPARGGVDFVLRASTRGEFYLSEQVTASRTQSFRKLRSDGTIDPEFNLTLSESALIPSSPSAFSSWDGLSLLTPNAVTSERLQQRARVTRISSSGTVDSRFAPRISAPGVVREILPQSDGGYLLAGHFDVVDQLKLRAADYNLVRILANGRVDSSFRYDPSADDVPVSTVPWLLGVQPEGGIVIARRHEVSRLTPQGLLDPTFTPIPWTELSLRSMQVDRLGRLYGETAEGKIVRWSAEGKRDLGFAIPRLPSLQTFRVVEGDAVVQLAGNTVSWHWPNGESQVRVLPPLPYGSGYTYSLLSDGGVFFLGDQTLGAAGGVVGIRYIDATGALALSATLSAHLGVVGGAFADVALGKVGVNTFQFRRQSSYQGMVVVHEGKIISSGASPGVGSSDSPIVRFLPSEGGGTIATLKPEVITEAQDVSVGRGRAVDFVVRALGATPRTVQWFRDGVLVSDMGQVDGATHSIRLTQLQVADSVLDTVRLTNAYGTEDHVAGRLTILASPTIVASIPEITVSAGQSVAMSFYVTGEQMQFDYRRNGVPWSLPQFWPTSKYNLDTLTLYLPSVSSADAGLHEVKVFNGVEQFGAVIRLNVLTTPSTGRLHNVSARSFAGGGEQSLILGFVVQEGEAGSQASILGRGIGPALEDFEVKEFMTNPQVTLRKGDLIVGSNDDWGGGQSVVLTSAQVGAFPIKNPSSKDAAILQTALSSGGYTLQVSGTDAGNALAEVYDASDGQGSGPRLVNLSSRSFLDQANGPMIIGFVIKGNAAQTVLVRATGPSLKKFGVAQTLENVGLRLFDAEGRKLADVVGRNDDPIAAMVAAQVGAFPVVDGSEDPALVVTLPPGAYTAHAYSDVTPQGVVLMEVYQVR
ncbi:MAG TPA: hypothetical protein PLN52_06090 [Opitutaceae bacterium]|nr:hypothetical protein [Opitutaceae bacterium]